MTGDDFLETLQADLVAVLNATPSLVDVNIIPQDDGDMEAKIVRMLGALTGSSTGKPGCVAVVMLPEITDSESNLPGPPVVVEVKVQVIEQALVNRAESGSGVRSSVAALRVLNALHLQGLAYAALYAGRKPVEPVEVRKGFLSHMVTLTCQYRGLSGPGKPANVTGAMQEVADQSASVVIGTGNSAIQVTANTAGAAGNAITASVLINSTTDRTQLSLAESDGDVVVTSGDKYKMALTGDFGTGVETRHFHYGDENFDKPRYIDANNNVIQWNGDAWVSPLGGSFGVTEWPDQATWGEGVSVVAGPASAEDVVLLHEDVVLYPEDYAPEFVLPVTLSLPPSSSGSSPLAAVAATNLTGGSDAGEALALSCSTSGAAIRYTTDGRYPTAENTLYTAPINGLEAGTIVRAAAYKAGLNPGDLTEILITE